MSTTRFGISGYSQIPYGTFDRKVYSLFTMPIDGGFDTNGLIHPGWHLWITENVTGNAVSVYGDIDRITQHSYPAKVDRFGNVPVIYLYNPTTYDLVIKNEYNVTRYTVTGFTV